MELPLIKEEIFLPIFEEAARDSWFIPILDSLQLNQPHLFETMQSISNYLLKQEGDAAFTAFNIGACLVYKAFLNQIECDQLCEIFAECNHD